MFVYLYVCKAKAFDLGVGVCVCVSLYAVRSARSSINRDSKKEPGTEITRPTTLALCTIANTVNTVNTDTATLYMTQDTQDL